MSASQALNVSALYGLPIDLLLSDVGLPDLSGPQLAAQLRIARPELKVLFMSGHDHEYLRNHLSPEELDLLLKKPFSVGHLNFLIELLFAVPEE